MKKRMSIAALAVVVYAGMLMTSCSNHNNAQLSGSGVFEATELMVSAKMAGTIIDFLVKEGDLVAVGQIIAHIDTEKLYLQQKQMLAGLSELRLNLENAQRGVKLAQDNLANIEKKFQRIQALYNENSATQQQYDDIETAYKAARTQADNAATSLKALQAKEAQVLAQLELLASQIRDATITAPIQGIVVEKYLEAGEIARPGGPVVRLADLQNLWIKIYVKETELGKIKLNQSAKLKISSYPDRDFPGRISWISSRAEFTPKMVQTKEARSDLVYAVKIEVKNPEGILKIGMPADVVIETK
ncbi:MAG: efflux RND transporter periplasmic adaptor subunit [candidate division KSB1 bacterium]|nr:efflux RND transporter periplasmic adaptor subunit [candidate division KSB1 bacterium]MDZ7317650.1 efflux RND transporter periplasmic adaptor subunit [candidate division KSB1 bacterium]MDZ7341893.1 efflux RND transporter periplasmic adaptor subunit [candidate division KSB1 bacterium]